MYYPEEVIEEVRMRSDIVDVISGYVKLQKKGSNLFGLCPFHREIAILFGVAVKQMYHCFGCSVSGNVITFVMEYENYSFREAEFEMLADRSGVKLPKMEYSKEAKGRRRTARRLGINKLAANYFYYQLKQPRKIGYDYLVKRKLTDETIGGFRTGIFENQRRFCRYLKKQGYEDEL